MPGSTVGCRRIFEPLKQELMTSQANLPKLLQIEPTNTCNFNCEMCLHGSGGAPPAHFLPLHIYERLAAEVFPALETLVLCGWGEPLLHPDCIAMLKTARRLLPKDARIKVTSNGSTLTHAIIDTVLEYNLIDTLIISCDKPPDDTADFPGHHSASDLVLANLDYVLRHPLRPRMHISIATVIMRSNIAALPALVEQFGTLGVDSIFVSHVFPYHPQLETEMLYTLMSSEAYDVFQQLGDIDPQQWFGLPRGTETAAPPASLSAQQAQVLEQARANGIQLNYALFQKIKNRDADFKTTQTLFEQARHSAERHGLHLDLPPLFGSLQQRECPYVRAQAAVIRSDGAVVPCFKNLYPHRAHFNGRVRAYTPHVFGSIMHSPLAPIWNADEYRQFRCDMSDMNKHIAWCGDCSFSLYYCYFSEEARHDCMLNEPFCADCPFSHNLTRCVL